MPRIKELVELAKQCYALATGTLNPDAKKALQDIGQRYEHMADDLRKQRGEQISSTEITQAIFPNDKK